jgi:hypothetical protein
MAKRAIKVKPRSGRKTIELTQPAKPPEPRPASDSPAQDKPGGHG